MDKNKYWIGYERCGIWNRTIREWWNSPCDKDGVFGEHGEVIEEERDL